MAKRLLTALVGIIVGVSIIALDNIWLYVVVISFFSAVSVWEVVHTTKCDTHKLLMVACVAISAGAPFVLIFGLNQLILPCFAGFMLLLFGIMLTKHKEIRFEQICMCGSSATLIPAALSCIILLRYAVPVDRQSVGVFMILYVLFCAWFGDSGAYFVGTFFGKHKLCPSISPKKTMEGFIGGIITAGVVAFVLCLVYNMFILTDLQINYGIAVIIAMVASVIGVLGDLSASVLKREFDVKDFGNLFPGHGGVLDRFDSVIFVAPFIYIVFMYLSPFAV